MTRYDLLYNVEQNTIDLRFKKYINDKQFIEVLQNFTIEEAQELQYKLNNTIKFAEIENTTK